MINLNSIGFENGGRRIIYNYDYSSQLTKYFNNSHPFYVEYDVNVQNVPVSIAIIPFLANFAPIAWFAGFSISVEAIDQDFISSLENIKKVFIDSYPHIRLNQSEIRFKHQIKNSYLTNKSAMLFSGGVDAYSTYFTHIDEALDLLTIRGADIDEKDTIQWERVQSLNHNEALLTTNHKQYVTSNLRTFYTHKVDLLLKDLSWWGKVQHGLALNGIIAPLSMIKGYEKIYIASSYTDNIDISWGSSPQIDNEIKWANTQIIHDGYELKRQDKIDLIVKTTRNLNRLTNLRVCYSLLNTSVNCSKCEKCYRTILGLILSGANPNDYGFNTSVNLYGEIKSMFKDGFLSEGVKYFWWELLQKINTSNSSYYFFVDKNLEEKKIVQIKELIQTNISRGIKKKTRWDIAKYKLQQSYPELFKAYLKSRQT